MKATFFAQSGLQIGEAPINLRSAYWPLASVGRARFEVPRDYVSLVEFKNYVVIQFDNGLPDWAGVVMPPRRRGESSVEVDAYTINYLLKFADTDIGDYYQSAIVGHIFTRSITVAEERLRINLRLGQVWTGGGLHSTDYHFKQIYTIIYDSIMGLEKCEPRFDHRVEGGAIYWIANLLEHVGGYPNTMFKAPENVVGDVQITEQGTIVNDVIIIGNGTGWSTDTRSFARAICPESIARYGTLQHSETYNAESAVSLMGRATRILQEQAFPVRQFTLHVANREPAPFGSFWVGDTVPLALPTVAGGYTGQVRIIGIEYTGGNSIKVAVQEVPEDITIKFVEVNNV